MNNKFLPVEKQIEIIALSGAHNNGPVESIGSAKFADGREGIIVRYGNGLVRKIAVDETRVEITNSAIRR
jgi:hypothetical protein